MFPPIFPIYIPALAPLHRYATLVWLAGVACLWLTRYTHQLGKRWGAGYYLLSALIRPAGVVLLAAGWLALYAPLGGAGYMLFGRPVGWLPHGNWLDWLWWAAVILSFALDVWAILALGLRRSFLFRHVEDRLVTDGPYALVRHPQFLSTIAVTFFGMRLFDPAAVDPYTIWAYESLSANWVLLVLALWLLAILEERELVAHFRGEYEAYARRVPRLVPTLRPLWASAAGRLREAWAKSAPGRFVARQEARYGGAVAALARLAGLGLMAVACGTIVVAAYEMRFGSGFGTVVPWRPWTDIVCWLAIAGFVALGAWALAVTGPRRFFFPWQAADTPVGRGPYALVRHPEYLAAIGVTLLATQPFAAEPFQVFVFGTYYAFGSHWLPYTVLVWLVAVLEDWGLAAHPGAAYEAYARRVPRLFPN